ncbi:MAG: 2-phosphosulfolactate phosphatase [Polyangiales bacterium]
MAIADQQDYEVRFEQGENGLQALAEAGVSCFVIVDVLSFSTCVDVAVARGAHIIPYLWKDSRAETFAREREALLAGGPGSPYALTVESLSQVPAGTRLVLPSPNGSTLAFAAAAHARVITGCLRNRTAVSTYLHQQPGPVAVIASGERWRKDRSLRPCFEDTVGAGAILAGLRGSRSPEAEAAVAAFEAVRDRLPDVLLRCTSGRELIALGRPRNIEMAAALDASSSVPLLQDGAFFRA